MHNNRLVRWTEEEDKIIIDNYPTMGSNVYKLLPGRNRSSCIGRAHKLKIVYKARWTSDEVQILKDNYPAIGVKAFELIPNKSIDACTNKAKSLKLYRNR